MEIDEGKMKKMMELLVLLKELNGQLCLFEANFERAFKKVETVDQGAFQ